MYCQDPKEANGFLLNIGYIGYSHNG